MMNFPPQSLKNGMTSVSVLYIMQFSAKMPYYLLTQKKKIWRQNTREQKPVQHIF